MKKKWLEESGFSKWKNSSSHFTTRILPLFRFLESFQSIKRRINVIARETRGKRSESVKKRRRRNERKKKPLFCDRRRKETGKKKMLLRKKACSSVCVSFPAENHQDQLFLCSFYIIITITIPFLPSSSFKLAPSVGDVQIRTCGGGGDGDISSLFNRHSTHTQPWHDITQPQAATWWDGIIRDR